MEIRFDKNNHISIVDKNKKVVFQQSKESFDVSELKSLGFSDDLLKQIKQMVEKRNYSFYA